MIALTTHHFSDWRDGYYTIRLINPLEFDDPTTGGTSRVMDNECLQKLSHDIQAIQEEMALDRKSARANSMAIASDIQLLKDDIQLLKDNIALQIKLQQLDFAYHNGSTDNFIYHTDESYGESQDLVQQIVVSFHGGFGHYLYGWTTSKREFHKKLCDQFMKLTGVMPHVE